MMGIRKNFRETFLFCENLKFQDFILFFLWLKFVIFDFCNFYLAKNLGDFKENLRIFRKNAAAAVKAPLCSPLS